MTLQQAERRIKAAMRVIVEGVLGVNSKPHESYHTKYLKVHAITEMFITRLEQYIGKEADTKKVKELIYIAKHIKHFDGTNPCFLMTRIEPERWMFKLM